MKLLSRSLPLAICATALLSIQAPAQDKEKNGTPSGPPPRERPGPVTSGDVLTQPAVPAPENGNIILKFGETASIYFKHAVKKVRLEDEDSVKAVPRTDHIIAFTGIAPGRSTVTIETANGNNETYGLVTVVREPHEVRIYQREQINGQTGERRSDSSSNIGGYVSLDCNEIRCSEREPELQPRLPK